MSADDVRQMVLHDEECAWVTDAADPCDCHADRAVTQLADRLDNAERAIRAVREVALSWLPAGKTYTNSHMGYEHGRQVLAVLDAALTPTTEET